MHPRRKPAPADTELRESTPWRHTESSELTPSDIRHGQVFAVQPKSPPGSLAESVPADPLRRQETNSCTEKRSSVMSASDGASRRRAGASSSLRDRTIGARRCQLTGRLRET